MSTQTTPEQAALHRAAGQVGGQAALASKLGFKSRRNVWPWFKGRRVPAKYCPAIERLTDGAVRCEELRPDVDWGVLRAAETARESQPASATAAANTTEMRDAA